MVVELKHNLSKAESIIRVKTMISDLQKQYSGLIKDTREVWNQDMANISFNFRNFDFNGLIKLNEGEIKLDFEVPIFATVFKSKLKSEIEKYTSKYLK